VRLASLAPQAIDRLASGRFVPVGTQDSFEEALGKDRLFQVASETLRIISIHLPYGRRMEIVGSSTIHDPSPLGAYSDLPQTLRDKVRQDAIDLQTRQLTMLANAHSDQQSPVRKVPPP